MFIIFEGPDGSGQSTQAKLLKKYLEEEKKLAVVLTKEPINKPPLGNLIRRILKKEISVQPLTLQLLFCADRNEHLNTVIKPALKKRGWIISDRYFYSTIAYGSLDLNIDPSTPLRVNPEFNRRIEWLIKINELFLRPDIVFLLRVRPEIYLEKIDKNRGKRQFFEKQQKLEKVLKTYKILSRQFSNIQMIDGEKNIQEVHQKIIKKLNL